MYEEYVNNYKKASKLLEDIKNRSNRSKNDHLKHAADTLINRGLDVVHSENQKETLPVSKILIIFAREISKKCYVIKGTNGIGT